MKSKKSTKSNPIENLIKVAEEKIDILKTGDNHPHLSSSEKLEKLKAYETFSNKLKDILTW